MSAFGVYTKQRREFLYGIAWRWLLQSASTMQGKELRTNEFYTSCKKLPMLEPALFHDHGRAFCEDLVDAVLGIARRHEEGVTVNLADEVRNELAYHVLSGVLAEKGMPIGTKTAGEIASRAHELDVSVKDMTDFYKMTIRDVLAMVLNGDN